MWAVPDDAQLRGMVTALRTAATAELAWTEDATPRARPVVPLLAADRPVIAATYADADWARSLATRPRVVLTLSDRRLAAGGWRPVAVTATPRLVEDLTGDVFCDELLVQELRKHPPSRAFADSVLLRREYWWYLPRLLVHLDVLEVAPFPERTAPDDVLVVTAGGTAGSAPTVRGARVTGWERPVELTPLDGAPLPDASTALLFGHDYSEPDVERWVSFEAVGALRDGALDAEPPTARSAGTLPRLRERLGRHRALHKACVAGIRAAESGAGGLRPSR